MTSLTAFETHQLIGNGAPSRMVSMQTRLFGPEIWLALEDRIRSFPLVRKNVEGVLLDDLDDLRRTIHSRSPASGMRRLQEYVSGFGSSLKENELARYREEANRLRKAGVEIVAITDDAYPRALRLVRSAPITLYKKGVLRRFEPSVAVVGTRAPSAYGHRMAREISRLLAQRGFIIVSGLARGIDTEAHCGALDVGGLTVAILGLSIEFTYPPENSELAIDISQSGALLSERRGEAGAFSSGKEGRNFVLRNRITSGLSTCTIIVESGESGGSFSQFRIAKEQGRPVFVLKPIARNRVAIEGYDSFVSHGARGFKTPEELLSLIEDSQSGVGRASRL